LAGVWQAILSNYAFNTSDLLPSRLVAKASCVVPKSQKVTTNNVEVVMEITPSGAARAPRLSSTASVYRAKEPFHLQTIPPNALPKASPAYVTHLLSLSTSFGVPTLMAISDDSTLTLIDKTSGVVVQSQCAFKDARITQARVLPAARSSSTGSFVGSISNGTVASWDARGALEKPIWTLEGPSRAPYLCVEPSPSDPNQVVAGTEQYGHGDSDIDIWDIRSSAAPLSKYNEVHSDDITALQFHPDTAVHAGILLSGSTDGLVSAIDTSISEEDDAVISVGNTGNSVARIGWLPSFGASSSVGADVHMNGVGSEEDDLSQVESDARRRGLGSVWAVGDMQTVSVFNGDKFDALLPTTDVRSATSLRPPWLTDYVIDAFGTLPSFPNADGEGLTLFVGRSEGGFAAITVPPRADAAWWLRAVFPEAGDGTLYGHTDIIRSVEWDPASNTLYTGGEDGNLCFWNFDAPATPSLLHSLTLPDSAPPYRDSSSGKSSPRSAPLHSTRTQRYTPYK
jgi:WD40 repeat protein